MTTDTFFRILFCLDALGMSAVRGYYQSKILRGASPFHFREDALSLAAGVLAALTTIVFGVEYIFFPGAFAFAYALPYPLALRWLGVTALAVGITVLWAAHHHLGRSFSSFVGVRDGHVLVESGPYRWIRHPIYLAFLLSYLGGGLVADNWVLSFIPVACYAVLVGIRMPKEERLMTEIFGAEYAAYMQRTGRLLPRIRRSGSGEY